MTPKTFRAIRDSLELTQVALGRELGYTGDDRTIQVKIARLEAGTRAIPKAIALLMLMFDRNGLLD